MIGETQALIAIVGMIAATYLTRIGGLWLMAGITFTRRIERFLEAMSGTVLIAILVPAILKGDGSAAIAITVAGVVMAVSKQALVAVIVGVAVAALARQWI